MATVFSHIVQKRLSQENEDVATEALAFILHSSDAARNGMMKLLRGIVPELPALHFRTQQVEGSIRPDMWGYADTGVRVFVENKFWAGLTDNQPVSYLRSLTQHAKPTVLLVVGPAEREEALWRVLQHRLGQDGISVSPWSASADVFRAVETGLGPILALTSWRRLLAVLKHEVAEDPKARNDLEQLHALCDAADIDAFAPVTANELSDQRTPAFILQLSSIIQATVDLAVTEGVLNITRLNPQANQWRIGRYARLGKGRVGGWLGTHFFFWRKQGGTPLWLVFEDSKWGLFAKEVRPFLEPWAARENIATVVTQGSFAVALDIPPGEEKQAVERSLVDRLKTIAEVLSNLPAKPITSLAPEGVPDALSPGTPDLREGTEVDLREDDAAMAARVPGPGTG